MTNYKLLLFIFLFMVFGICHAQNTGQNEGDYKKRVLETAEIDILASYYSQDGNNAAVTGGLGTEELTDITGTLVIAEVRAVAMVIPADGPSFGIAPAGTWMWISFFSNTVWLMPSSFALERM